MKWAVIDIGSNSMRLAVYDVEKTSFKTLFREKIMAGLAGYVEAGQLSGEGIDRACEGLLEFQHILEALGLERVSVFATASLRNVANTDQAVARLQEATGLRVEVISGEQEALYGYRGAMCDLAVTEGVFVDVGGASTEIASFEGGELRHSASYAVGSLKLYRDCVKKLLPGKASLERIDAQIKRELPPPTFQDAGERTAIACVGGTARAALKLARQVFATPAENRGVTARQLEELFERLSRGDKQAIGLILKTEPERVHTLIPGLMLLRYIVRQLNAREIVVSQYGVREGYLCQRIQREL